MAAVQFPSMFRVRQKFPPRTPLDLKAELNRQFGKIGHRIRPGQRVAVGVGSRGIDRLAEVVAAVLDKIRSAGANPFIVPAMGSHGGATPEGQVEILAGYGINETSLGAPILAAMEAEEIGNTEDQIPVFCSREALRADWIIVVNRVKPHTDFSSAEIGSGLQKMLVVGLGKQIGASTYHRAAIRLGFEPVLRRQADVALRHPRVLGGVAIVEDQRHEPARLAVAPRDEIRKVEAELLAQAQGYMPRLPFPDIDLLIVDQLGKNISGTGMDANVIGREIHGYSTSFAAQNRGRMQAGETNTGMTPPIVRRLFVRDLTPETRGNAIGIGMADFTTTRLVRAVDPMKTSLNALTALSLNCAKLPIAFGCDREAIEQALSSLALRKDQEPAIVRVKNTLALEEFSASTAAVTCLGGSAEVLGPSNALEFDPSGNLQD
jgi:hypothetical protein